MLVGRVIGLHIHGCCDLADVASADAVLSDEEKDQLDKTAVSREDVKAISTLLRSLKQQGGTSFKKNDDDSLKTIGIDG